MKNRRSNNFLFGLLILFGLFLFGLFLFGLLFYKTNETFDTNIAFYTCFYGTTDNIAFKIPEIPTEKYPCYYFTNNKDMLEEIKKTKWIGIYDNKPVTEDSIESCFYGKKVKVVPHDFKILKNYNYTIFFDSKLNNINVKLVENYINKYFIDNTYALLLCKHDFITDNVWNEFEESMNQPRYQKEKNKYISYINTQLSNGLDDKTSVHCKCGFLIRKMHHPKIKEIDDTWYSHIKMCGIQDQISFHFVKQLFEKYIFVFDEKIYDN
jgi:hypothetical protein